MRAEYSYLLTAVLTYLFILWRGYNFQCDYKQSDKVLKCFLKSVILMFNNSVSRE